MFLLKNSLNFFLFRKESIILKIMAVASSCGGFLIHRLFYVLPNPLNRITAATDNTQRFGLSNLKYDKNGNITHLTRGGHLKEMPDWDKDDDFGTMDQLDYQYFDGSNRLSSVTDGISKNDTSGKGEFVDGNKDGDDYVYDPNGNMTQDLNKGIKGATLAEKGIEYNHLNLPTLVRVHNGADVGTISYIYDATGVKLRKNVLKQGETTPTATDYAGNYIYENGKLQFFSMPEGYVEPKNPDNLSQGYDYIYQYKDHLGNVRLSYKDNNGTTEILSENNYYPFGLEHKGYNNVVNSSNVAQDFKYQGQELEEALGLDMYEFELRHYDPAIGRFMTTDPYEQFHSPYVAMGNNPVVGFDPTGGLCYDANGNTIACPDGSEFDEYRDNEDNHINILPEVVVTGKSKETEANEAYWKEINDSAEILDKIATLETGRTSADRQVEEPVEIVPMQLAMVDVEPTQLVFWPIEVMGGASWLKGVNIFRWGSKIKASNVKQLKALIKKLSKPGSELNAKELKKFEKLVEKFGGKIRRDLNPVKGKIKKPHVQVEGLGKSIESRHVWLKNGVK